MDEDRIAWMRKAAHGIPSARLVYLGTTFAAAEPRWLPRLCGAYVHNTDDPPNGFDDEAGAKLAAERYRADCRRVVLRLLDMEAT